MSETTITQMICLKRHVLVGGGEFVGIQESLTPDTPSLVLFNSPTTGSTLALPVNDDFSAQAVHQRIEASDKAFGKGRYVKIPRAIFERYIAELKGLITDFESQSKRGE